MGTVLTVENVVAGYQEGIDILNDVSLRAEKDIITGIIGPNGAGKSTLLKTIFGFLHPHKGRIFLDGQEIQSLPPYQLKKMGLSYIPQQFNVFPHLTVKENLLLGAWVFRKDRKRLKERIANIYEQFPILKAKRRHKAALLSGGELRMLSIAKEVMTDPSLLLVDEPSAGLAPKIVSRIYSFLKEIKDQGVTLLLVDQNIAKAIEISNYMYLLEIGKIRLAGPKNLFEKNIRAIIKGSLVSSNLGIANATTGRSHDG